MATFYFYPAAVPTGKIGACYPASQWAADANGVNMTLPSSQTATTSTYDPLSMIMLATPVSTITTPWNCTFNRKVAVNKIALSGLGTSKVYSVKITASASNLAGTRRFNPSTGSATSTYTSGGTKTITVTYSGGATPSSGALNVFFNSWEVASGTLTVRINFNATDGASFKEGVITLASGGIQVNKLNTFSLNAGNLGLRPSLLEWGKAFYTSALNSWESHIGFVDADGSHRLSSSSTLTTSNAWAGVHYIPIAAGAGCTVSGTNGGVNFDKTKNQHSAATAWSMTFNGTTYDFPAAYTVAAKGLLDIMTSETSDVTNSFPAGTGSWSKKITFANKTTLQKASIPNTTVKAKSGNKTLVTGAHPWYEKSDEQGAFGSNTIKIGQALLIIQYMLYWSADATHGNGAICNYMTVSVINTSGYSGMTGYMSAMRLFLIMARIYKYIIENKVTDFTSIMSTTVSADLYGFSTSGLKVCGPGSIGAFAGNLGRIYKIRSTADSGSGLPVGVSGSGSQYTYNFNVGFNDPTGIKNQKQTIRGAFLTFKALCVSGTWSNTGGGGNNSQFTDALPSISEYTLPTGTSAKSDTYSAPKPITRAGLHYLDYTFNANNGTAVVTSINGKTLEGTTYTGSICLNRCIMGNVYFCSILYNAYCGSWNGSNAYDYIEGHNSIYASYKD